MNYKYLLITAFMLSSSLNARVLLPDSASEFYRILADHPFAVVHFIKTPKSEQDTKMLDLKSALRTLSRKKDFERAGIAFIGVNLVDVPELERAFPLHDDSVIMLFSSGQVIKDSQGMDVILQGHVSEDEIENLIERYWGADIDAAHHDYKTLKYEQREVEPEDSVVYRQPEYRTVVRRVYDSPTYYYPRYSSYTPSYYPGFYRPYGYYGGYGYGYPFYRRWSWFGGGPRFGLGFGFGGRRGGIGFGFGF